MRSVDRYRGAHNIYTHGWCVCVLRRMVSAVSSLFCGSLPDFGCFFMVYWLWLIYQALNGVYA